MNPITHGQSYDESAEVSAGWYVIRRDGHTAAI